MKIYTKTGDDGTTALFAGKRIAKSDERVEAYGTIDELSSIIGMVIATIHNSDDQLLLTNIQKNLYHCMAYLAGAEKELAVLSEETKKLEHSIDSMEKKLPRLNRFILPQGGMKVSWIHIARTVCRRAERNIVRYKQVKNIIQYFNRLSDFLFVMARKYTKHSQEIQT